MTMPLISVIIPVYNVERYLARCLDSVIQNTYQNLEIICVNDGSRDNSAEILQQYAQKDPRIIVITKENGGLSSARNAGLKQMTGEFVTFVDSDDFVHPQYFEMFMQVHMKTGADLVISDFLRVTDAELPIAWNNLSFDQSKITAIDCRTCFKNEKFRAYCWNKMFKREYLEGIQFQEDCTYCEDVVFIAELWERNPGLSCCFFEEALYGYYNRAGSIVDTVKGEDRMNLAGYLLKRASLSKENDLIYLGQVKFRLLWYLKYYLFTEPDRAVVKECLRLMRSGLPLVLKSDIFSNREKAYYLFKCVFPRVRSPKTMLKR